MSPKEDISVVRDHCGSEPYQFELLATAPVILEALGACSLKHMHEKLSLSLWWYTHIHTHTPLNPPSGAVEPCLPWSCTKCLFLFLCCHEQCFCAVSVQPIPAAGWISWYQPNLLPLGGMCCAGACSSMMVHPTLLHYQVPAGWGIHLAAHLWGPYILFSPPTEKHNLLLRSQLSVVPH